MVSLEDDTQWKAQCIVSSVHLQCTWISSCLGATVVYFSGNIVYDLLVTKIEKDVGDIDSYTTCQTKVDGVELFIYTCLVEIVVIN